MIPNCVARYDDGFNLNCVGDTFQSLNVPTILFEAGHYPNDYDREEVRYLIFLSILKALESISKGFEIDDFNEYFSIPENAKQFYDVIIRNARLEEGVDEIVDLGIQYHERLVDGKVEFIPIVEAISKLDSFYGHREIDAKGQVLKNQYNTMLEVASENDFVLLNTEKISLKP